MRNFFIFLVLAALLASCAANRSFKTEPISNTINDNKSRFPGVDSTIAVEALDYADRMLVDGSRVDEADSLYQHALMSFELADSLTISDTCGNKSDSLLLENWMNEIQLAEKDRRLFEKLGRTAKIDYILANANQYASLSKLRNPFSLNTRGLLVQINMKQGEQSGQQEFYVAAINEIENLLLVDKSNPDVYTRLAECYYALEDWEKSYSNFKQAENVMHAVSQFKMMEDAVSHAHVDTAKWVYLLRGQGEARAKQYDAPGAINCLTMAQNLTRSASVKSELEKYLTWIDWDSGNIQASELRDEIFFLEEKGDYRQAKKRYIDLLGILETNRTKNEINWKIASIDYQHLNNAQEAVQRLHSVVKSLNKEINSPENHAYIKDYAAMCFSIGVRYLNANEFRQAYIYLSQASKIEWEHRATSYLQLALLSRANPAETIKNCSAALQDIDQLNDDEIKNLHQMLFFAYKQNGEFEKANQFNTLIADID